MPKQLITSLIVQACLLLFGVTTVVAQTSRRFVIQIPFDFILGSRTLPAGKYSVERNDPSRPIVLMLKNAEKGIVKVFLTHRVEGDDTCITSSLIFKQSGGDFYLFQVWMLGDKNGNELSPAEENRRDQGTNVSRLVRLRVNQKRP